MRTSQPHTTPTTHRRHKQPQPARAEALVQRRREQQTKERRRTEEHTQLGAAKDQPRQHSERQAAVLVVEAAQGETTDAVQQMAELLCAQLGSLAKLASIRGWTGASCRTATRDWESSFAGRGAFSTDARASDHRPVSAQFEALPSGDAGGS